MAKLGTYNGGEVAIIIGGRAMSGLGADTFCSLSRDEDSFTTTVGADGEVTRSKTNNRKGTLELTLLQSSDANSFLQSLVNADENLNGAGIGPVVVRDISGSFIATAAQGWIRKPADIEFAREAGERTWTIDLADADFIGGGN